MNGEERLRRLRWRCRRGMLELDLTLQQALDRRYEGLSDDERELFERLLEVPDWELLAYLQGSSEPMDMDIRRLVRKIRQTVEL